MPLSARYVVPLRQHAGSPAKALVRVGDAVLRGPAAVSEADRDFAHTVQRICLEAANGFQRFLRHREDWATPENAGRAIVQVRPAGVDSHTGVEAPDGAKDPALVGAFVGEARRAFALLERNHFGR